MAANIYGAYPCSFAGTALTQITSYTVNPGLAPLILGGTGSVDQSFIAINKAVPGVTFTTTEVARVLGIFTNPFDGFKVNQGGTQPVFFYFQKHLAQGTRSIASDFVSVTITDALCTLGALQFNDGEVASISVNVIPVLDGANPMVVASGVSDPGASQLADQAFTGGPVKVNAVNVNSDTLFDNVVGGALDFGMNAKVLSGNGQIYPRFAGIQSRSPSLRIAMTDGLVLTSLDTGGASEGLAASIVATDYVTAYLTKVLEHGTRVPDATNQHISLQLHKGLIIPEAQAAQGGASVAASMRWIPSSDGTNAIIGVSTAAVIPRSA